MPRLTAWAVRTPAGDAAQTLAALAADVARPGCLAGRLFDRLDELVTEVRQGQPCDLLLLATTKGDLPEWTAAILGDPPELAGGPAALAAALGRRHGCPAYAVSAACASGPVALAEAARALSFGAVQRLSLIHI
jgi:acetyl-CoA acetyltransferase